MTGTFTAPNVDWAQLSPVILVLGAAVIGVLVEAFVLDAPDEVSLLEQPTEPASRIVATPTAANSLFSIGTPFPVTR